MARCGAKCGEGACYAAGAAHVNERSNHAARFHPTSSSGQGYCARLAARSSPALTGSTRAPADEPRAARAVAAPRRAAASAPPGRRASRSSGIPGRRGSCRARPSRTRHSTVARVPSPGRSASTSRAADQRPPMAALTRDRAGRLPALADRAVGGRLLERRHDREYPVRHRPLPPPVDLGRSVGERYAAGARERDGRQPTEPARPCPLRVGRRPTGPTPRRSRTYDRLPPYVVRFVRGRHRHHPTTGSLGIARQGRAPTVRPTPSFGSGCDGGGADAGADANGADAGGNADAGVPTRGVTAAPLTAAPTAGPPSTAATPTDAATDDGAAPGVPRRRLRASPTRRPSGRSDGSSPEPGCLSSGADASRNGDADDEEASGCDCPDTGGPPGGLALTTLVVLLLVFACAPRPAELACAARSPRETVCADS